MAFGATRRSAIGRSLLVVAILFASFEFNLLRVVAPAARAVFQVDSDQLVVQAVTAARDGDIGYGGFLVLLPQNANPLYKPIPELRVGRDGRVPYVSQFGLHGQISAVVAPPLALVPKYLELLRAAGALALAAILGWIVLSAWQKLGAIEGTTLLLAFAWSPWLILFSRSLYWQLWLFYLPIAAVWWAYQRPRPSSLVIASAAAFGAVMLRELCSYEFGTNVVIACGLPIVIVDAIGRASSRTILWNSFRVQMAGAAGLVTAIGAHFVKLSLLVHSASRAVDVIRERLVVRSYGTARLFGEAYFTPGKTCQWLATHSPWTSAQCENVRYLSAYFSQPVLTMPGGRVWIPFGAVLIAVVVLVLERLVRRHAGAEERTWRWALGVGFAASVSWAVAMPYHMLNHLHVDAIVWQLFFLPVAFAYIARRAAQMRHPTRGGAPLGP